MSSQEQFDVAVVGASVGGCTAARLFALAGARVALIERRPDPDAYKVTCTHAILPSATPTIERLGLAPLLAERGALRTQFAVWTPHGGWVALSDDCPDGWGVTRSTLDPLLRELTVNTPGVEFLSGWTASRVLSEDGRTTGVEIERPEGDRRALGTRLVVGADGRDSSVARLARVPARIKPHDRFFYFAYWRGVRPETTVQRVWFLEPDGGAHFPNEHGIALLAGAFHRSQLPEVRADLEGAYMRQLEKLPDGPDLSEAEQVSKVLGKLEMPNAIRPAARPGLAFVGDAALAADPVFGVGIGFAFQSAHWLVEETSGALDSGQGLDRALRRYGRKFLWRLGPHHATMSDFSTRRGFNGPERLALTRAAVDPVIAHAFGEVMTRERSPLRMLDPRIAARLAMSFRAA